MKIEKITKIAENLGWYILTYQDNIGMLSLVNVKKERINIYLTKMTVATCIEHPKKGKTQLFRKNVSIDELKKILGDPRIHTGKGYYTRA